MHKGGQNEGYRVLDDFVCEAIHESTVPRIPPNQRGQNEGVRVVEELSLNTAPTPYGRKRKRSVIARFLRWIGKGVRMLFNAFSSPKSS
jgi:hypothetical protein